MPSLFSQPLYIDFFLGPSKEEANEILKNYGGGRAAQTFLLNTKASALINPVDDGNNSYCLFLAIALTIENVQLSSETNMILKQTRRNKFHRLISQRTVAYAEQRQNIAKELIEKINQSGIKISPSLDKYSVDEHVPLIQKYFDQLDPEKRCRIVVFGEHGMMKPLFKGKQRWRWTIPIYHFQNHFYGIRKINQFFMVRNYCIDCESNFST